MNEATLRQEPVQPGIVLGWAVPALLLAAGLVAAAAGASRAEGFAREAALFAGLGVLAVIAAIDARTLRAPNVIVYPSALVATLLPFAFGLDEGLSALGGGAVAFALLLVAVLFGRGSMGYGDVKAGYVCGAVTGLGGVLQMLVAAFAIGGLLAAVVLVARIRGRKDAIAFTPFLFAGTLISVFMLEASPYLQTLP